MSATTICLGAQLLTCEQAELYKYFAFLRECPLFVVTGASADAITVEREKKERTASCLF